MEEPTEEAKEFQDILVQLAKAVATSTAQLVMKAKTVSEMCDDQALQEQVIHSATHCAFATSQLVATAKGKIGDMVDIHSQSVKIRAVYLGGRMGWV